jgi:hypothetical protein
VGKCLGRSFSVRAFFVFCDKEELVTRDYIWVVFTMGDDGLPQFLWAEKYYLALIKGLRKEYLQRFGLISDDLIFQDLGHAWQVVDHDERAVNLYFSTVKL